MTVFRWGLCTMVDGDGQFCVLEAGHTAPHSVGPNSLRAWLEKTTDQSFMRTYTEPGANEDFQREARLFEQFGFLPVSQSGATMSRGPGAGAILALGVLAFGRRTNSSSISVMFRRGQPAQVAPVVASIPDQIRALGELRDAGLVTPAEFEAKKAELLSRM